MRPSTSSNRATRSCRRPRGPRVDAAARGGDATGQRRIAMPLALTYPGVYVQEIPSGVRTIIGVGTSITAFVGRARRGPVDKAITVTSFGEFQRIFGGLWLRSAL